MRVGVPTGGGDCPGLHAVLRAIVRKGEQHDGDELIGFRDGWRGVIEGPTIPSTSPPWGAPCHVVADPRLSRGAYGSVAGLATGLTPS